MTKTVFGQLKQSKHYGLGTMYFKQDRFSEALECFKELLLENPLYITDLLIFLYKSITETPQSQPYRYVLVDILITSRRYSEALEEIVELIERDKKNSEAYNFLGRLYKKNMFRDRIKELFEDAFYAGFHETVILDILPSLYLDEKNIYKNILLYEKLVTMQPDAYHFQKNLAGLYEKAGRYEDAAKLFDAVVQKSPASITEGIEFCEMLCKYSPQSLSIRKILIHFYSKSCNPVKAAFHIKLLLETEPGTLSEAEQLFKHLFELYPETLELNVGYADILVKETRYSEAVVFLQTAFKQDPDSETLVPLLKQILEHYPKQVLALQLLCEMMVYKKEYEEALFWIEKLLDKELTLDFNLEPLILAIQNESPSHFLHTQYLLSKFFLVTFQYEKAVFEAKRLLESSFAGDATLVIIEANMALDHFLEAWYLSKEFVCTPKGQGALFYLKESHTRYLQKHSEMSQSIVSQAFIQYLSGDFEAALTLLDQTDHMALEPVILKHLCWFEQGRFKECITSLSSFLAEDESEHQELLLYILASSFYFSGQFSDAAPYFSTTYFSETDKPFLSVFLNPSGSFIPCFYAKPSDISSDDQTLSFSEPYIKEGLEAAFDGQYEKASQLFSAAQNLDNESGVLYSNKGVLELLQQLPQSGLQHMEKALTLDADNAYLHVNQAWAYVALNQWDNAFECGLQALQQKPDFEPAYFVLGVVSFLQDKSAESISYFKKAGVSSLFLIGIRRFLMPFYSPDVSLTKWLETFKTFLNDV